LVGTEVYYLVTQANACEQLVQSRHVK